MLSVGDSKVSKLYHGDTECKKAYLGDTIVLDNSIKFYNITATISPSGAGTISGTGTYAEGTKVTLVATPSDGYEFTGWTENGVTVSTNTSYTFTVDKDRIFTAVYERSFNSIEWSKTSIFPSVSSASGYSFRKAAYGKDKFVVVGGAMGGNNGYSAQLYSSDGINFVRSSSGSSNRILMNVSYGASRFVAVGYISSGSTISPLIMTNETGSDYPWSFRSTPSGLFSGTNKNLHGLCYGSNKFVAFQGYGNQFVYSSDGIIWSLSTLPISAYWTKIAYGNGKFIAVSDGTASLYSEDGLSWKQSTLPSSNNWFSIAYGANKFVILAYTSNQAAYSKDGINWTQFTLPISDNWIDVAYGSGMFVAVAYNSNNCIYSKDGLNWETTTMPSTMNWQTITYGDGKFVSIAYSVASGAYGTPK